MTDLSLVPRSARRTQMLWVGRVASALPVLMLMFSAFLKLSQKPEVVEQFGSKLGYPERLLTGLGIVEITCTILYIVPRTAVLGAVLLTGYLGGAIATHLRVGEAFTIPLVLGVLVWAGLYFRDERIRALLPLQKTAARG
jgi:hypothetical protein